MSRIKKILSGKWLKSSSDESRKPRTGLDESEAGKEKYVIELPDGAKFKIPEMPPSRLHWG